jgi:chromate reductase
LPGGRYEIKFEGKFEIANPKSEKNSNTKYQIIKIIFPSAVLLSSFSIPKNSMKNIFIINGSTSKTSANQKLIDIIVHLTKDFFNCTVLKDLKTLPHFDPELSIENTPQQILDFRKDIENADGVIICTPEYVFSIPSCLKNAIEWSVSTTVFSDKPVGLITASASGAKAHEDMQLIMQTIVARFTPDTTLLIQGVKGKINDQGEIVDVKTQKELLKFIDAFRSLVESD